MGGVRGRDDLDGFELEPTLGGGPEESTTCTEDDRHHVDAKLIEQPRVKKLVKGVAAAADHDVLVAGELSRGAQGGLDAPGDEVVRGTALLRNGRLRVVGHDDDRDVPRRILAPWTLALIEHAPSDDDRTSSDVPRLKHAPVGLCGGNDPAVESTVVVEGIPGSRVRARDVSIE
jgi:hypothetical protein